MHSHIDTPSATALLRAVETLHYRFPQLRQQVTELDISAYLSSDNTSDYGATGGDVPESIIAQQGWLYGTYFKVLRALKDKIEAVTFWGIADDNTWLDNFPINRLDEPLPFDMRLQAKPAYWGIVDPTKLPGFGLSFALTSRTGPPNARVWTITATNPSSETAFNTQINAFRLEQVSGRRCEVTVTPAAFPVLLGDIPAGGMSTASFTLDFSRCEPSARFGADVPWSSARYETGTLEVEPEHSQERHER
jgi:endo-1,4-beta-xylanase